jgi:hypothetical protein
MYERKEIDGYLYEAVPDRDGFDVYIYKKSRKSSWKLVRTIYIGRTWDPELAIERAADEFSM